MHAKQIFMFAACMILGIRHFASLRLYVLIIMVEYPDLLLMIYRHVKMQVAVIRPNANPLVAFVLSVVQKNVVLVNAPLVMRLEERRVSK